MNFYIYFTFTDFREFAQSIKLILNINPLRVIPAQHCPPKLGQSLTASRHVQVLRTGSIDSLTQGKVMKQVQGPSREYSLEQQDILCWRHGCRVKLRGPSKRLGMVTAARNLRQSLGFQTWPYLELLSHGQRVWLEALGETAQGY